MPSTEVTERSGRATPIHPAAARPPRRRELGEFLRRRRSSLQPEEVGLLRGRRRRTPGLRREEVAALAGVGATWYAWIEQGRDVHVSPETLAAIGRALRLSPSDLDYLARLGGDAAPAPAPPQALAALEAFLATVTGALAMVMDPRLDVVAFNRLADAVYDFDGGDGPFRRNHVWRGFMDPRRRRLYPEFERHMPALVGLLRSNHASHVGDRRFEELLEALRVHPEFDRVWRQGAVAPLQYEEVAAMRIPRVGVVRFRPVRLLVPGAAQHALFALVPCDPVGHAALARLRER